MSEKTFRYVNDEGGSLTFAFEDGWLLYKPTGIDTLSVTVSQSQGIGQIGSSVSAVSIQPRVVNMSGRIALDDDTLKRELLSVVRPDVGGRLYADDYYLECRPTTTPSIGAKDRFANFAYSLIAPYPYWIKSQSVVTMLSGITNLFKFPWYLTTAYRFGQRSSDAYAVINNSGQVPVPFKVVITATDVAYSPSITDMVTGKALNLNMVMAQGEVVTIDVTHDKTTVNSSINGDIRGLLTLQSNLFSLAVGNNLLKPDSQGGADMLDISIEFSPELVGIAI